MAKKRFIHYPIDYREGMERLEQLGQHREPREENLYAYPITEREQILIRLYSYYQLGMTPQPFYQKWDVTQEDIALICSCSAHALDMKSDRLVKVPVHPFTRAFRL